jgi:hypothetical protein
VKRNVAAALIDMLNEACAAAVWQHNHWWWWRYQSKMPMAYHSKGFSGSDHIIVHHAGIMMASSNCFIRASHVMSVMIWMLPICQHNINQLIPGIHQVKLGNVAPSFQGKRYAAINVTVVVCLLTRWHSFKITRAWGKLVPLVAIICCDLDRHSALW